MAVEITDELIADLARGVGRPKELIAAALKAAPDVDAAVGKLRARGRRMAAGIIKRSDDAEADANATKARAHYEARRREADEKRKALRELMSLGARLDAALTTAQTLATAYAAAVDPVRAAGKPGSKTPPQPTSDTYVRWRLLLENLVGNLEDQVDRERRTPLEGKQRLATKEERDRRLSTKWKGVPSAIVAALDPELGSARTIENSRAGMGQRRVDGTDLPPREDGKTEDRRGWAA